MKGQLKKLFKVFTAIVILFPIVLYGAIVITNNFIADQIEKKLVEYALPENTVLVDSLSVAGKLVGNGNGMQYMGCILVESDLSAGELKGYYGSSFEDIEVTKQETATIDFIHPKHYSFSGFSKTDGKSYYCVTCWDSNRDQLFEKAIIALLDLDLRGH